MLDTTVFNALCDATLFLSALPGMALLQQAFKRRNWHKRKMKRDVTP